MPSRQARTAPQKHLSQAADGNQRTADGGRLAGQYFAAWSRKQWRSLAKDAQLISSPHGKGHGAAEVLRLEEDSQRRICWIDYRPGWFAADNAPAFDIGVVRDC